LAAGDAGGELGGWLVREARPVRKNGWGRESRDTRQDNVSNSLQWPSKQQFGFRALLRFQLLIHVHPNKKSEITVDFHFLGDLVFSFNSIPKDSIHTSKQSLSVISDLRPT
jgi:hypothetical protein